MESVDIMFCSAPVVEVKDLSEHFIFLFLFFVFFSMEAKPNNMISTPLESSEKGL
jgi:hypothetical protein